MGPKKLIEIVETLVEALNKRKRRRLNKVGRSKQESSIKKKTSRSLGTDTNESNKSNKSW